jgi:hypothetical protein
MAYREALDVTGVRYSLPFSLTVTTLLRSVHMVLPAECLWRCWMTLDSLRLLCLL